MKSTHNQKDNEPKPVENPRVYFVEVAKIYDEKHLIPNKLEV